MITLTGEYALRAMAHLAKLSPGQYALAQKVGHTLEIPPNYLGKVLQELARHGLLESQRGRNGGFRLNRPSSQIMLIEILSAVEPSGRYEVCILGRKQCSDETACPIHFTWKEARNKVLNMFQQTTLARLMEHNPPKNSLLPALRGRKARKVETARKKR